MKELYKAVATILQNDATLIALVGYDEDNSYNIIRGYQFMEKGGPYDSYTGPKRKWLKLVAYYFQPAINFTDFTSGIRRIPLIVRVYDRDNDLNVETIAERVIYLLHDADLDVTGKIHVQRCFYDGDLIATSWNNDLKSYEKVLRFDVIVHNLESKS